MMYYTFFVYFTGVTFQLRYTFSIEMCRAALVYLYFSIASERGRGLPLKEINIKIPRGARTKILNLNS